MDKNNDIFLMMKSYALKHFLKIQIPLQLFIIIITNNMSSLKKKELKESTAIIDGLSRLENKQNLNSQQIREMIQLLKAYEALCIQRQDYNGAQNIKNKIDQIKGIEIIQKRQSIAVKQKQQIQFICKEGQDQIKRFQECWDQQIQQLVQDLKKMEQQLANHQILEIQQFKVRIHQEIMPRAKFSSIVLQKRKYLTNLIKTRNYKEAQAVKNLLKDMQNAQQIKWAQKFEEKKILAIEKVQKKQKAEMQAMHIKLQGIFNEKIKERDRKFEILLKKNRKRRIDSSKPSQQRIRSKNSVLTESKIHLNI